MECGQTRTEGYPACRTNIDSLTWPWMLSMLHNPGIYWLQLVFFSLEAWQLISSLFQRHMWSMQMTAQQAAVDLLNKSKERRRLKAWHIWKEIKTVCNSSFSALHGASTPLLRVNDSDLAAWELIDEEENTSVQVWQTRQRIFRKNLLKRDDSI